VFTGLLCHTAEVYRRQTDPATGQRLKDRFGQQLSTNPQQHTVGGETLVSTFPCRLTRESGGLQMMERSVDVYVGRLKLYCDLDADIKEDDAVRVLDSDGTELLPLSKILVKTTASGFGGGHHLECSIYVQRGPS